MWMSRRMKSVVFRGFLFES
ncbi:hypothetical protein Goarm_022720 [Gossypium armourianum]|uniref:Uncharacterized protein n=1 Tax=Gossypium armourianum TaxID=34283 RepID=A0A7J9KFU2_9ROSI|nr:hypothetical protein [Gossypium armourianum]